MKRSNIVNQRSFWVSLLASAITLGSSLVLGGVLAGCAADSTPDDDTTLAAPESPDRAALDPHYSPTPVPPPPARALEPVDPGPTPVPAVRGDKLTPNSDPGPTPVPAAKHTTPNATGEPDSDSPTPIPAVIKP